LSRDVRITFGPPGTGKTTDLMNTINQEIEDGTDPRRIAFVSFTRKAANEAIERATERFNFSTHDLDNFRTLHSMAYRHLGLGRNDVMGKQHWNELGGVLGVEFSGYANVEEGLPTGSKKGDLMLQILSLARNRRITLKDQFLALNVDLDWNELQLFQGTLIAYKREKLLWDFTDMLERFHYECNPINVDVALIDEAQDLSKVQWMMAKHAFKNVKRVRISGDYDQCQPAGTMVRTNTGDVPIEKLRADHELLSYSRRDAAIFGKNRGFSFVRSIRFYTGLMYTLKVAGNTSRSTDNHLWLCKWTEEAKKSKYNVVYLMKRGDNFRIGWAQLHNPNGGFHLTSRATGEKADALWILKLVKTKKEASIWESILATNYSIPTMPFEPVNNAVYIDREAIDQIFKTRDV